MKIRELEELTNESVDEIRSMLDNLFGDTFVSFKVHYFLGEDELGTRMVVIAIMSNLAGEIYSSVEKLERHETPVDVEGRFIDKVLKDLFIAGITFLHTDKIKVTRANRTGLVKTVHFHSYLN